MRNKIVGGIGVVWGGAVVVSGLLRGQAESTGSSAYQTGQMTGLIFGGLLFVMGLYYLLKGGKKSA